MKNLFLIVIAFTAINAHAFEFRMLVDIDDFSDLKTYSAIKMSGDVRGFFLLRCTKGKLSTIIGAYDDYFGFYDQKVLIRVDKNQTIKVIDSQAAMQRRGFYLTEEMIKQLKNGDSLAVRVSSGSEYFDYQFDISDAKKAFNHIEPECKI